ncbi:phage portal protein [Rhodococcus hoagii]|nr:phage portal protein [Prescottella equi]
MAKLWHHLRGRGHPEEQRFGLNDLTTLYNRDELLHLGKRYGSADNETIDNDFVGYINGAYKANGAVFAVSLARMLVFTEVRFAYQRFTEDGRPGDLYRLPSLKILEKPWPNGTTGDLLARAIQDTDLCGNHYVVREGSGPDSRLRRLRPDWVSIILTSPPDKAVASDVVGYLYKPGGTEDKSLWKLYPVDGSNGAIAHWTPIPDPEAMYRGMSWLTPVLREVMHDNAATKHKLKFFENAATPNLAVSFKETVTAEQFREFMAQLDDNHGGGDNAYKTLYLGGGADVRVIGSKMEEINFKSTQACRSRASRRPVGYTPRWSVSPKACRAVRSTRATTRRPGTTSPTRRCGRSGARCARRTRYSSRSSTARGSGTTRATSSSSGRTRRSWPRSPPRTRARSPSSSCRATPPSLSPRRSSRKTSDCSSTPASTPFSSSLPEPSARALLRTRFQPDRRTTSTSRSRRSPSPARARPIPRPTTRRPPTARRRLRRNPTRERSDREWICVVAR